jgi:hypothetical protein
MRRTGTAAESSGHGDTSFFIVPDRQAQSSTVFDSVSKTVEGVEARVNVASFDLAVSASG